MTANTPQSALTGSPGPWAAGGPGLTGWAVRLREIRAADHRTLAGFDRDSARNNDPQVGGYRHWAAHRGDPADSGDDFHFAIEKLRTATLVGSIWVQADASADRFSYGIGIGVHHRRCGYAADAVATLLAFMFGHRRYRECEVSINGGNFASLALHGDLGFHEEGRPRDTELQCGEVRYPVLMSITADQFAAHHPVLAAARGADRRWRGRHGRIRRRGRHWPLDQPR